MNTHATTAMQAAEAQRDSRLQQQMQAFFECFAPRDHYDRARFEAAFYHLVSAIHEDAMRPYRQLVSASLLGSPSLLQPSPPRT